MKLEHALPPFLVLILLAVGPVSLPAQDDPPQPTTQRGAYVRNEIPGHYTVGFYADQTGSSTELTLADDQTEFEAWIGVTGDSTRTFSGLALRLELPYGVEVAGPIRWVPRSGLKEAGDLEDPGITVDFPHECAQQKGQVPVMLGRIPLRILPGLDEALVTPGAHLRYGLSVELCSDARAWPKPYAEAVPLRVRRSLSLWERLTSWFR